jgi:hypothetical protein
MYCVSLEGLWLVALLRGGPTNAIVGVDSAASRQLPLSPAVKDSTQVAVSADGLVLFLSDADQHALLQYETAFTSAPARNDSFAALGVPCCVVALHMVGRNIPGQGRLLVLAGGGVWLLSHTVGAGGLWQFTGADALGPVPARPTPTAGALPRLQSAENDTTSVVLLPAGQLGLATPSALFAGDGVRATQLTASGALDAATAREIVPSGSGPATGAATVDPVSGQVLLSPPAADAAASGVFALTTGPPPAESEGGGGGDGDGGSSTLSSAAKAGIAVAVIAGAFLVAVVVWLVSRQRRARGKMRDTIHLQVSNSAELVQTQTQTQQRYEFVEPSSGDRHRHDSEKPLRTTSATDGYPIAPDLEQ